jgi:hypothetical protein
LFDITLQIIEQTAVPGIGYRIWTRRECCFDLEEHEKRGKRWNNVTSFEACISNR